MILARTPESLSDDARAAIAAGVSIEAFDASLPSHYRAVLPPLHRFIADFDRPTDGGDAAADSILDAARAAKGN
jgi:hypothetical protein